MTGNMLIAHGGGPTPVINNSLRGAIEEAKKHPQIGKIYGARFGAEGLLRADLIDLGNLSEQSLALLSGTPASAIGSCRRKLTDADYPAVLDCLRRFDIRYFFYNGGNDSMDTCNKIHKLAQETGYDLRVMGIPKTIDNDLMGTDHTPGYGSAAQFTALAAAQLSMEAAALPIHVIVLEVMGRNAGWLTAAAALFQPDMPSEHLVYLPERELDADQFLADVQAAFAKGRGLLVSVCEGVRGTNGRPIGDTGIKDGFGHAVPGGAAQALAALIMDKTPLKARAEKPGLLGRASMAHLSRVDSDEAYQAGAGAVRYAVEGVSGFMVGMEATRTPAYSVRPKLVPLETAANTERLFPPEWMTPQGNGVTDAFRAYLAPLVDTDAPNYAWFAGPGRHA